MLNPICLYISTSPDLASIMPTQQSKLTYFQRANYKLITLRCSLLIYFFLPQLRLNSVQACFTKVPSTVDIKYPQQCVGEPFILSCCAPASVGVWIIRATEVKDLTTPAPPVVVWLTTKNLFFSLHVFFYNLMHKNVLLFYLCIAIYYVHYRMRKYM